MAETLLEKALTSRKRGASKGGKEELDLAIACLRGIVSPAQAAEAIGISRAAISYRLVNTLRDGVMHGQITIIEVAK